MPMGAVQREEMSTSTSSWKSRFSSRRMSKENSVQGSEEESPVEQQESSLSASRKSRKGMRGRLSRLIPSGHSSTKLSSRDPSPEVEAPKDSSPETKTSSSNGSEQVGGGGRTNRAESRVR